MVAARTKSAGTHRAEETTGVDGAHAETAGTRRQRPSKMEGGQGVVDNGGGGGGWITVKVVVVVVVGGGSAG